MFTGIVEELGFLKARNPAYLHIGAKLVLESLKVGDSIAVNGVCLTVTSFDSSSFHADIMPETLRLSNLGKLSSNSPLNLERALTLNSRMGGHLVQGHVDGTARLISSVPDGSARLLTFETDQDLTRYMVHKGFVAVNGVSLTITDLQAKRFSISLVNLSGKSTNLGLLKPGDTVNIETDIIGKYVEKLCRTERGISPEFLAENGF
ncbi:MULTISPECIES: riboflavin synthase [Dehalococcoides]|uniref:Riboflavin synthase n=2 Tax=root TaxID=1 RepID=A0AB38Z8K0_9CHLR|nr:MULTISPECIES: riboflavin synthase [Dehalococcoides]MEA4878995.1 riboflavin synthase [Dehalococcoides mccartyi]OBW61623.1 MAG: riboflavin synthase subunit alpha [Dehalococcoides mccartyi]POZ59606.1 Riboflavin synthase eubacterial/eukaryotic [Dehalococcoides mccartyi]WRO06871.1 riboflavin synthase [Dehalococcoides mccartyi]BAZ97604.1 riboflavin synthase subunit alpha [Dehalococcoides mccartyi]